MTPGDRVRVVGSRRHGFLNGREGTVLEEQPFQLYDETAVQVDGYDSFYYLPTEALFALGPCPAVQVKADEPPVLPHDSESRKGIPLVTGLLDYFPAALREVAKVSKAGNDKHNPGEPLHWARGKSMDQADAIARHLLERGGLDPDTRLRQTAHMAWRALALLQLELEEAGEAPLARGASVE